ncbi:4-(cytidine 5'-diphospho)-2-C-methyl-D-erythritol kinase [Candidatus Paracaedibacter symbiosus]|uniref:4-(cytidine 5'-diphospho)-2-C-methyl-D-erythritol kinase n=1 Tax=Candidatus Paracaedibacter symbiosus TaxID=244582 RepID=UPI000509EFA6|nr:4-(cytidine 5'-diphospho)-2-C-methyl-D-erythritol kinase [Candidatus Paracaedibacter symbiosus]
MLIHRLAPAKLNLMLHVVGRFPDGFHRLQTLMTFVDFGDMLTIAEETIADELTVTGEFAPLLHGGSPNSVIQAKEWFYRYFNRPPFFFKIRLQKNLPVAAGIGGGTSDAAAMIATLLAWHQLDLSLHQKQELVVASGRLGADVPVCLSYQLGLGNLFWLDGSGTSELPQALPWNSNLDIVLINPRIPVNTRSIFKSLNQSFSVPLAIPSLTAKAALLEFMNTTQNDLEPLARFISPEIGNIPETVQKLSNETILCRQSGSGATYFVVVKNESKAQHLAEKVQTAHPHWWVKATKTCSLKF